MLDLGISIYFIVEELIFLIVVIELGEIVYYNGLDFVSVGIWFWFWEGKSLIEVFNIKVKI